VCKGELGAIQQDRQLVFKKHQTREEYINDKGAAKLIEKEDKWAATLRKQDKKFTIFRWCTGITLISLWFLVVLLSVFNCYNVIGTSQIFVPDIAISAAQAVSATCPDEMQPPTIPKDLQATSLKVSYTLPKAGGLKVEDYKIMFRVPPYKSELPQY
jgi:hypothetical protein